MRKEFCVLRLNLKPPRQNTRVNDVNDTRTKDKTIFERPTQPIIMNPKRTIPTKNTDRTDNTKATIEVQQTITEHNRASDDSYSATGHSNSSDTTLDNNTGSREQSSHYSNIKSTPTTSSTASCNKPTCGSNPSKSSDESRYYSVRDGPPSKNVRFNHNKEYFIKTPSPQNDSVQQNEAENWRDNPAYSTSTDQTNGIPYQDKSSHYHFRGYWMPHNGYSHTTGIGDKFHSLDGINRGNYGKPVKKECTQYRSHNDNLDSYTDHRYRTKPRNSFQNPVEQVSDSRKYKGIPHSLNNDHKDYDHSRGFHARDDFPKPSTPDAHQSRASFRNGYPNNKYKRFPNVDDRRAPQKNPSNSNRSINRQNIGFEERPPSSWNPSFVRDENGDWREVEALSRTFERPFSNGDDRSYHLKPDRDRAFSRSLPKRPSFRTEDDPRYPNCVKDQQLKPLNRPILRYQSLDNGLHTVGPNPRISSFRAGSMQRSRSAYYNRSVRVTHVELHRPCSVTPQLDFRKEIDSSYFDRNKIVYDIEKNNGSLGRFRKLKNKLNF